MIAAMNAPIPGSVGVVAGVEPGVLAAVTGIVVTRPASGFAGATSAVAALVSTAAGAVLGTGRLQVTHPASGLTRATAVATTAEVLVAELGTGGVFLTNEANRVPDPVVRPDEVCRALSDCTGF
jgi:hypothetical protein